MAKMTNRESRCLERLFEMEDGWASAVFSSNADMARFFVDEFDVDIYDDEKYAGFGASKANRLRCFWHEEPDYRVGESILALVSLRADRRADGNDELLAQAEGIARRLMAGGSITVTTSGVLEPLSHEFIAEHDKKCREKMSRGDYDGAITNARSMVETVLLALDKELSGTEPANDGRLEKLYKRVRDRLNLDAGQPGLIGPLREVLSGLNSLVNGLAALRNDLGDSHGKLYRTHEHHARLTVHAAVTLTDFLLSTHEYQQRRLPDGPEG